MAAITSVGLLLAVGGTLLWAVAMCRAADQGDRQQIYDETPDDFDVEWDWRRAA